jgi:putative MATE family efflux protein
MPYNIKTKTKVYKLTLNNNTETNKEYFGIFWPIFFTIAANSAFSIIDSFFIAVMGEEQLAGLGLVMSFVIFILAAIGSLSSGLGINLSHAYGAGLEERLKMKIYVGFFISILFSLIVFLLFLIFGDNILSLFDSPGNVSLYMKEYFDVWIYSIPFIAITSVYSKVMNTTGMASLKSKIVIFTLAVNSVLNYYFIFGVEGYLQPLGMEGAALATVLAFILQTIILAYFLNKKGLLKIYTKNVLKLKIISFKIIKLSAHFLMGGGLVFPIAFMMLNIAILQLSLDTIVAYAAITRIELVLLAFIMAISSTSSILISKYNGAKNKKGVYYIFKLGYKLTIAIVVSLIIFAVFFGKEIGGLFLESESAIEIFSTMWIVFLVSGLITGIMGNIHTAFYSLKTAKYASVVGFTRNLTMALIPYFATKYYGLDGFLISMITINTIAMSVALYFYNTKIKERIIG